MAYNFETLVGGLTEEETLTLFGVVIDALSTENLYKALNTYVDEDTRDEFAEAWIDGRKTPQKEQR